MRLSTNETNHYEAFVVITGLSIVSRYRMLFFNWRSMERMERERGGMFSAEINELGLIRAIR